MLDPSRKMGVAYEYPITHPKYSTNEATSADVVITFHVDSSSAALMLTVTMTVEYKNSPFPYSPVTFPSLAWTLCLIAPCTKKKNTVEWYTAERSHPTNVRSEKYRLFCPR